MSSAKTEWTPDRIELLKTLWGNGKSTSEIQTELGGVTRNAVIGKVHRLKLKKRGSSTVAATATKRATKRALGQRRSNTAAERIKNRRADLDRSSLSMPAIDPDLPDVTPLVGSVMGLSNEMCKFPLGDPLVAGFGFCGEQRAEGQPYCEFHCKRAYIGYGVEK